MADLAELRARLRSAEKRYAEASDEFYADSKSATNSRLITATCKRDNARNALGNALIERNAIPLDDVARAIDANAYADPDGGPDWVDAYDLKTELGIELGEGADVVAVHERRVEAARVELRAAEQRVEELWAVARTNQPTLAINYDQRVLADLRQSIAKLRLRSAELELVIAREQASGAPHG